MKEDQDLQNLFEKLPKESLEARERSDMRSRILAFIKIYPVRRPENNPSPLILIERKFSMKRAVAIAVLVLAVTAGGAAAAEGSLPGDLLYPVKVNVNENVRAALTVSAEKRADFEAFRAERRLIEAEKLAARAELRAEIGEKLATKFEAHANLVAEKIEKLEAAGNATAAAAVSARLEKALEAHQRILENADSEHLDKVLRKVEGHRGKTVDRGEEEQIEPIKRDDNEPEDKFRDRVIKPVQGVLLGRVKIGPICPNVNPEMIKDGRCEPSPATYTSREIIVYAADSVTVVARVHLDREGDYWFALKPGDYIVDIGKLGIDGLVGGPKKVKLGIGATVRQDLEIDTGIR